MSKYGHLAMYRHLYNKHLCIGEHSILRVWPSFPGEETACTVSINGDQHRQLRVHWENLLDQFIAYQSIEIVHLLPVSSYSCSYCLLFLQVSPRLYRRGAWWITLLLNCLLTCSLWEPILQYNQIERHGESTSRIQVVDSLGQVYHGSHWMYRGSGQNTPGDPEQQEYDVWDDVADQGLYTDIVCNGTVDSCWWDQGLSLIHI